MNHEAAASMQMTPAQAEPKRLPRRTAVFLFCTVLLFCSWFFHCGHVNQTARYDAVSAWFENTGENKHTFRIDRWLYTPGKNLNTSDWSEYGGHYYSNKSPGTTWFGTAMLAPVYPLERHFWPNGDGISPEAEIFNAWYLNFMMSVLPTAFAVLSLADILLKLGAGEGRASAGSLLIVLGTALFPYSTTLLAHSTVAACLIFSLGAYLSNRKWALAEAGAWFGAAVLFDYSAGMLLPLAAGAVIWRRKQAAWAFFAGGVPFAVLYCVYNAMCFGGPFSFAAQHINPVYRTDGGAAGGLLALPNPWLMLELLFGAKRGIFAASPFFLFAVPGFLAFWRRGGGHRRLAVFLSLSVLALLLMNASFNGWHGGASITARYMIPIFPAIGILAVMTPLNGRRPRFLFTILAALSLMNMFAAASYTVMPTEPDPSPLYGTAYRHLFDTEPPPILMTPIGMQGAGADAAKWRAASRFTLGELAGLHYGESRLVLFLLGLAAWIWLLLIRYNLPGDDESKAVLPRLKTTAGAVLGLLTKRQADALFVLAGLLAAAALLKPGAIPWSLTGEMPVHKTALDAAEAHTFANPFARWGLPALCYQLLYLVTKDIITLAFWKTALSLAATFRLLAAAAKRCQLNAALPILFASASPYLLLAHKSLRGDALLLPAGALALYAAADCFAAAGTRRRIRAAVLFLLAAVLCIIIWMLSPSERIPVHAPFALLLNTFGGFLTVFHRPDPGLEMFFLPAAILSILLAAWLALPGLYVSWKCRDKTGLLAAAVVLFLTAPSLSSNPSVHPFAFLPAAPFLAYLEARGAAWILSGRFHRAASILLAVSAAVFLVGWLGFLGTMDRDAGNRNAAYGTTLAEQQAGAERMNAELRRYAPGPIAITAKDRTEQRAFFAIGWLTALDRIRDPYLPPQTAEQAPGFFIGYRDGERAANGYLRILSRFKDNGALQKMPKIPSASSGKK